MFAVGDLLLRARAGTGSTGMIFVIAMFAQATARSGHRGRFNQKRTPAKFVCAQKIPVSYKFRMHPAHAEI
jgi:hypothetical protein